MTTSKPAEVFGPDRTRYSVEANTLPALLLARRYEQERGLTTLSREGDESRLSYAALFERAARLCTGLRAAGLQAGDSLLLQLESAEESIVAFWACTLAGVVVIPLNAAISYRGLNPQTQKLIAVWRKFAAPPILVSPALMDDLGALHEAEPAFTAMCLDFDVLAAAMPATEFHEPSPDDAAAMFLTSGSTGNSKGVQQSHAAMLAMADATIQMNGFGRDDVTLNWMSLDHAGSLVFLGVMSVAAGCEQVHVPVDYVLKEPSRWLDLIHRYRASISWAPNFAFSLYLDKQAEFLDREWDLSCMRFMVNAGEAIVSKTARRFIALLETFGLPADALRPAFGMVETCSGITWSRGFSLDNSSDDDPFVNLGPVIPGAGMRIVDDEGRVVAQGVRGRLQLRGPSVFGGYVDEEAINSELFAGGWMVTGDLAYLEDDCLFITGREKDVIIINGNNFYSHEIEGVVGELPSVVRESVAACGVSKAGENTERVAIFFAVSDPAFAVVGSEARAGLEKRIRAEVARACGVTPSIFVCLQPEQFPRTEIGKIKRPKLRQAYEAGEFAAVESASIKAGAARPAPKPAAEALGASAARRTLATDIAAIWCEVLELESIDFDETFFELGGHSLLAIDVQNRLEQLLSRPVSMVELFNTPTVNSMADYFSGAGEEPDERHRDRERGADEQAADIAVIGIGCRFPGAHGPDAFWKVLDEGLETIRFFTPEEAVAAGVPPAQAYDPAQVNAAPILDDVEGFDLGFWGISQREAELIDPQQRVFLETAWEAFEDAGYRPSADLGRVGVYAAAATNTYLQNNVYANSAWVQRNGGDLLTVDSMDGFNIMVANDKDYLPTRVSYKLDLVGPSISIQTACSSTLVAVHEAFKSLRSGECEMAIAGGCALMLPQYAGHLYEEGMINTPDGHCRAYDAQAKGTIFGSGSAAVLLKPLDRAIADGDRVYAVIKGGSIANDGGQKMGFTAPSMMGEYRAIAGALRSARVSADTIGFVEGHGTGTLIGDPIEVQAMTKAFRLDTESSGYCALGSVKTNIGHMGIASGIAGFVKTVLALHHKKRPGTLHFETPNPAIDFDSSPFFVSSKTEQWPSAEHPRRAGVNSLGIGGTNVHMILEEAPEPEALTESATPAALIVLSAQNDVALAASAARLAARLRSADAPALADIAFTLQSGRTQLAARRAFAVESHEQLLQALGDAAESNPIRGRAARLAFQFSGQGSQLLEMGRGLYAQHQAYRDAFDASCLLFAPHREFGIKQIVFGEHEDAQALIDQTAYTQPALFCVHVALVQLYRAFGVHPDIVLGHSIGEVAAAWTAGVLSLEEAVTLVEARSRLMQSVDTAGAMIAINTDAASLLELIDKHELDCEISGYNSSQDCVLSGTPAAIDAIGAQCEARAIKVKRLAVSHAFHSRQMEPILADFERAIAGIAFKPPQIPLISNVTGEQVQDSALDARYWSEQVRRAVRYEQCVETALALKAELFVEIAPLAVLTGLGRAIDEEDSARWVPSLRKGQPEELAFAGALAALFESGAKLDFERQPWNRGRRVSLPTYPWQRQRCWIEPDRKGSSTAAPGDLFDRAVVLTRQGLHLFSVVYDPQTLPVLNEHRVFGSIVPPAALYTSQLLNAGRRVLGQNAIELRDLNFVKPLVVDQEVPREVQLSFMRQSRGGSAGDILFAVELTSQPTDSSLLVEPELDTHVVAEAAAASAPDESRLELERLRSAHTREVDPRSIEQHMANMRVDLGPSFHWFKRIDASEAGETPSALATLVVPDGEAGDFASALPAGLLDCLWQTALAALPTLPENTVVPSHIDRLSLYSPLPAGELVAYAAVTRQDDAGLIVDIELADAHGGVLLSTRGLRLSYVEATAFQRATKARVIERRWERCEVEVSEAPGGPLWIVGKGESERLLAETLKAWALSRGLTLDAVASLRQPSAFSAQEVTALCLVADRADAEQALLDSLHSLAAASNVRRCVAVTSRAFATGITFAQGRDDGARLAPRQSAAAALALSFAHEASDLQVSVLDCESTQLSSDLFLALTTGHSAAALGGEAPVWIALRDSAAFSPCVHSVDTAAPSEGGELFDSSKNQLVTGGAGGVGLATVQWMAQRGARRFVITGRQSPNEAARAAFDALAQEGCSIEFVACDVTSSEQVSQLAARVRAAGDLDTVVHAAGVRADGLIDALDAESMETVVATKLVGAENLATAMAALEPNRTIYYSSIAGWVGGAGQGNYAAANAALDALAARRSAEGKPTLSVAWGPWQALGMTASLSEQHLERLSALGYSSLARDTAFTLLGRVIAAQGHDVVSILEVDPSRLSQLPGGGAFWRQLSGNAQAQRALGTHAIESQALVQEEGALVARVSGLSREDAVNEIQDYLAQVVCDFTGAGSRAELELDTGFFDLGLDSLAALEMRKRLEKDLGKKLKSTLLLDYPTIEKMSLELVDGFRSTADLESDRAQAQVGGDSEVGGDDAFSEDELLELLEKELGD